MKRLLKLLARLYPSAWRARYAAEFEALLEDRPPRPRDAFDILLGALTMRMTKWSFTRITLATALAGLLLAVAFSFTLPNRYVSQSLILVDTGMDATGHPNGNIAQDNIDPMLATMLEEAFSKSSLVPIIQKYNLYSSESTSMPLDSAVIRMRKDIAIWQVRHNPSSPGLPGFMIGFSYPDPRVAQRVDFELSHVIIAANLQRGASGTPSARMMIWVRPPTLPQKPTFPKRGLFGAGGLLVGLAAGLTFAAVLRVRRSQTASTP